jgi:hypothetical protein
MLGWMESLGVKMRESARYARDPARVSAYSALPEEES